MATSTSTGEFPLWAVLTLYARSNKKDTYCDYFAGFTALVRELEPIAKPKHYDPAYYTIPWHAQNYALQRMAVILGIPELDLYMYVTTDQEARRYV